MGLRAKPFLEILFFEFFNKMKNQGRKKNIMSTLGVIENVERTRYLDEVENINAYPLDEKIQLLQIQGRYSRYTGNFARLAAEYYGRLPERAFAGKGSFGLAEEDIELEQDSLTNIGSAVAGAYHTKLYDEGEHKGALPQVAATEPGFIEKRMQEIDASPDRDAIIFESPGG
jgi:hypothetical protein